MAGGNAYPDACQKRASLSEKRTMSSAPRFPPPWDIEEANAACFIVKDNNDQALAYVYFEHEPADGRRQIC